MPSLCGDNAKKVILQKLVLPGLWNLPTDVFRVDACGIAMRRIAEVEGPEVSHLELDGNRSIILLAPQGRQHEHTHILIQR